MSTVRAALGGWIELVDLDQRSAIPSGFILKLAHELTPAYISDGFGERVVLDHILDLQTLDAHHLVFADDLRREFVLRVASSIGYPGMEFCDLAARLVSILGTFALAGKASLRLCQFLFVLLEELGVAVGVPVRGDHHRLEAQVQPDLLVEHGQCDDLFFEQDGHKVVVCTVFGDGHVPGLASIGQGTRPVDIEGLAHLGKREVRAIPGERTGSKGRRLRAVLVFERRILRSAFKEVEKGAVQVAKRLLQGNRRDLIEPGRALLRLSLRQACREVIVVQALTSLVVGIGTLTQSPVVDDATTAEGASQHSRLFGRRVKPILVGFLLLLAHGLQYSRKAVSIQGVNTLRVPRPKQGTALSSRPLERGGSSRAALINKVYTKKHLCEDSQGCQYL